MRAPPSGYARFAWGTLAFTLFVIVWGAFVRATGSGAGCGSHWPLCNGEVVPRAPAIATVIEFAHRVTSGLSLLLVVGLWWAARRRFGREEAARRAAAWAVFLMLTEALIGAGLVLFEYVADDARVARALWVGGHLVNTLGLVAALTACAAWASGLRPPSVRGRGVVTAVLLAALLGMVVLGVSGAVTALGDTLFPATTLAEAEAQTFSETAHLFVRLRIWHPTLAVVVGALVAGAAVAAARVRESAAVRRAAACAVALYGTELFVGLCNVWWLAPVPLQLVHLLLADLVWIALVLLCLGALAGEVEQELAAPVAVVESRA